MNVGILTFHNAINYGAVLQCYALCQYLKENGCNVYVINYSNDALLACYKAFNWHRCVRLIKSTDIFSRLMREMSDSVMRKKRRQNFNDFIHEYFSLIEPDSEDIQSLDYIIIGSDQVWNTRLTKGFDDYYWGNFKKNKDTKLISYAASIEEYWSPENDDTAKNLLDKFDAISVREIKAVDKLSKLLPNKDISLSVDPTLLIDKWQWNQIAKQPSVKEPYLFVYQVRPSDEVCRIAEMVAKRQSLKIVYLSADVSGLNSKCCCNASPQEYLGLFKHASFVVCSSFHGTVFSLILEKPFVSVRLNDGKDSRVETLLSNCKAQHRFLSNCNEVNKLRDLMEIVAFDTSETDSSKKYLLNELR